MNGDEIDLQLKIATKQAELSVAEAKAKEIVQQWGRDIELVNGDESVGGYKPKIYTSATAGDVIKSADHLNLKTWFEDRAGVVVADIQVGAGTTEALGQGKLPVDADGTRLLRLSDVVKRDGQGRSIGKVVEEVMEKAFPHLISMFYPRQYENVGAYHSPRMCGVFLAMVCAEAARYGFRNTPTAYRLLLPGMKYMVEHLMPMFFIAPDMLEAIKRTILDQEIDWTQMKLPFEHGVFVLPKGGLVHPETGEVSMLVWGRIRGNSVHKSVFPGVPDITVEQEEDAMVVLGLCPDEGIWYDFSLNSKRRPTLRMGNVFCRDAGVSMPDIQESLPGLDERLDETDREFVEQMAVVAFGAILLMQARPELVDPAKMLRRIPAKADKPKREFWQPNIIGAKYKLRREVPKIVGGQFVFAQREKGTHASPRPHWRVGCYRRQPCGPKRAERKLIWIEPVFVLAEGR